MKQILGELIKVASGPDLFGTISKGISSGPTQTDVRVRFCPFFIGAGGNTAQRSDTFSPSHPRRRKRAQIWARTVRCVRVCPPTFDLAPRVSNRGLRFIS